MPFTLYNSILLNSLYNIVGIYSHFTDKITDAQNL